MRLTRREWLATAGLRCIAVQPKLASAMALSAYGLFSGTAYAGSYLDRAALLVFEAGNASEYLRRRLYDDELARVVQRGAKARIAIAHEMLVPSEVTQAHPHLLLVLEHHERAANAAVQKDAKEFLKQLGLARDEEQLFRSVLKQLGWELPRLG